MLHDPLGVSAAANASASIGVVFLAASEQVQIVLIGAVVTVITGVVTVYFAYKAKTISQEAKDATKETAVAVDGRMEKLLEIAKALAHAEGVSQGAANAENKAAVIAAAKAEGAQVSQVPLAQPSPLLPSQVQPVHSDAVEGVKLTREQIDKMIQELQAQLSKTK